MKEPLAILFILFAAAGALPADNGFTYSRAYRLGSAFSYTLRTDSYNNGKLASETVSESRHEVVDIEGVPYEQISFVSLKETTDPSAGTFQDLSDDARKVPSFLVSLDGRGKIKTPVLDVPSMSGPVTDLVTYYVAMSQKIGASEVHNAGEVHQVAELMKGSWADNVSKPLGDDVLQVSTTLVFLDANEAVFKSVFAPPERSSLSMSLPWMQEPVTDGINNNFQQIQRTAAGEFNIMWGNEGFTIITTVMRDTGIIEKATMRNDLKLRLKIGCDAQYAACQAELPLAISRAEVLTLNTVSSQ